MTDKIGHCFYIQQILQYPLFLGGGTTYYPMQKVWDWDQPNTN